MHAHRGISIEDYGLRKRDLRTRRLDVGASLAGPAVLDQLDCTTVICPGQTARVDEWKNLIVTQEP